MIERKMETYFSRVVRHDEEPLVAMVLSPGPREREKKGLVLLNDIDIADNDIGIGIKMLFRIP